MRYILANIMLVAILVSGCGRQEIGVQGFTIDESVGCSMESKKLLGVQEVKSREDGLEEWLLTTTKPFRDFKQVKLVVDTETGRIAQIRAGRKFNDELDALHEFDRSLEVFKSKYKGEWNMTRSDVGRRVGVCSTCQLKGGLSIDVNVVPYSDHSVVVLMMSDDDRLGRRRREEVERDSKSLR